MSINLISEVNGNKMAINLEVKLNEQPVFLTNTSYSNMCTIETPKEESRISITIKDVKKNGSEYNKKYGIVAYIYGVSLNLVPYGDSSGKDVTMLITDKELTIKNWIESNNGNNPEIVYTEKLNYQVNTVLNANPNVAPIMLFLYEEKQKMQLNTNFSQTTTKGRTRGGVGFGKDTNQTYETDNFDPQENPYLFLVRFTERKNKYALPETQLDTNNLFQNMPRV